ncbi:MAG: class I tRNA ligase family protein [Candidatus Micrarchaeota archaeon]|nr:class I tRNA ligase family protein [Candidatus Micrarchaeota archaeon]
MSGLVLYNSLSRRLEKFVPRKGRMVRLYTCGPTAYARPHIGNLRTYCIEDTLKRYLSYLGFRVRHAMNITDFDRTILREEKRRGMPREQLVARAEKEFMRDAERLSILPADCYPHVSKFADKMAEAVRQLVKKGFAYWVGHRVFFDISRFPSYGRLAGKRLSGAARRVSQEEYRPSLAGDFLIWESCRHKDRADSFCTSLGPAHPPWNIHCATMSLSSLGGAIDIAAGGRDNLFNHHENTRAVASCLIGKEYARHWVHIRHLIVEGKKMSKTKGNTIYLPDMEKRGFSPRAARMVLVSAHYRKRLNFTWEDAEKVKKRFESMRQGLAKIKSASGQGWGGFEAASRLAVKKFELAMSRDLDIPKAIGVAEEFICKCAESKISRRQGKAALSLIEKFDSVLACLPL